MRLPQSVTLLPKKKIHEATEEAWGIGPKTQMLCQCRSAQCRMNSRLYTFGRIGSCAVRGCLIDKYAFQKKQCPMHMVPVGSRSCRLYHAWSFEGKPESKHQNYSERVHKRTKAASTAPSRPPTSEPPGTARRLKTLTTRLVRVDYLEKQPISGSRVPLGVFF
jgi:hypothetical protein